MLRKASIVGAVAFGVLAIYALLGLIQAAMLSGAPNYEPERLTANMLLWGAVCVLATFVSIGFVWFGRRSTKESRAERQHEG